jgi:hypothetical protein
MRWSRTFIRGLATRSASLASEAATAKILDQFGWETADLGKAEWARAIEPLCMLWCILGFTKNEWTHSFKLLRA